MKYKKVHPFYESPEWRRLSKEVLEEDKHECQICKTKGKYERATMVHHVKPREEFPELALSKTYIDEHGNIKRNLISVSRRCHEEECHPDRLRHTKPPLTEERW